MWSSGLHRKNMDKVVRVSTPIDGDYRSEQGYWHGVGSEKPSIKGKRHTRRVFPKMFVGSVNTDYREIKQRNNITLGILHQTWC